jgi:hypothetical protein
MRAARATRPLTAALLILALALASACGSKSSTASTAGEGTTPAPNIHGATTKFVFHTGLALGVFHRYVYKPFKAGDFRHPLLHKLALLKAGAAALFIAHEVRLASEDAKASALLRKFIAPLQSLASSIGGLASGLKSGHPDTAALGSANSEVEALKGGAAAAGVPVREIAGAVP